LNEAVSGRPLDEALSRAVEAIQKATTFLLTSHVNPDGDALGSAGALGLALKALGKRVRVILGQPPPEKFKPFLPAGLIEVIPDVQDLQLLPIDLCILLDTNEPERSGILEPVFFRPGQRRMVIDHHPPSGHPPSGHPPGGQAPAGEGWFDPSLIVVEAPATGNLVGAVIDRLGVPLDRQLAELLWIAIATDTGWFRFPNTTAWALADASRLVRFGLDTERIYQRVYADYTVPRARALGAILGGIKAEFGGDFLWSCLSLEVQKAEGVGLQDLDGMMDTLKSIRGARLLALLVELEREKFKVSLRSAGNAEVSGIARRFGGGGHAKAAGCRMAGKLEDVVAALRSAVTEELSRASGP
jgi:phosphoesterase RecJ-like protein